MADKNAKTKLKEAGGPAAGNEGLALGTFWRLAYVAAALVLTLALVGAAVIFHANEARLIERHLRAYSATVAQELGNRVAAVRGQLKRWSVDPGVRAALLDGRVAALRAKEEELALLIPGALDVMLFSTDGTAAGGEAARRLSFAGLDMVQRVQDDGRIAALEAHRVRQADEHLGIAGPIVDDTEGRVIGIVHVMLPMSLLPKTAGSADADARFAFRQQVGDTRVVLRPGVADAPSDGVVSAQLPIPDTRLELFAWVRPTSLLGSQLLPFLGGLYLISLLLLGAAIGFPARDLRLRTNADLVNLTALAEDAAAQQPLRPTRGRVRELSAATDALRRSLRKLAPVRELQPKPAELAPTSDGTSLLEVYEQSIDFELDLPSTDGSVPGPSSALPGAAPSSSGFDGRAVVKVPPQIFRAYDIRGLVGPELTDQVLYALGLAVGSEAAVQGQSTCIVARDQRASGEGFARALVAGLCESGCDVVDLGIVPAPLAYFAAQDRGAASAAIVTASHNPSEHNGLKVVLGGRPANRDQIQGLRERIERNGFRSGSGTYLEEDVSDDYIRAVVEDVTLARPMKLVLDCGFATASQLAPNLYRALECDVSEINCTLDPDQEPRDPAQPKDMQELGAAVVAAGADLGIAFDADADRIGIVDSEGNFISADRVLMLLSADVLARSPGSDIVYDVKCSHRLGAAVLRDGGRPVMGASGHSFLKQKVRELGAPLGGEFSGHIVFSDRWNGFDDAAYAGARLLEVLALDARTSAEVFADYEVGIGTPELFVPLPAGQETNIMESVLAMADRLDGVEVNTVDGLRAEFDQGWGLVRASNTQSGLVFRFEAEEPEALERIRDLFRRMMELVAPEMDLPF